MYTLHGNTDAFSNTGDQSLCVWPAVGCLMVIKRKIKNSEDLSANSYKFCSLQFFINSILGADIHITADKTTIGNNKMIAYLELVFIRRIKILRTCKAAVSWFTTLSYFYKKCLVSKNSSRHVLLSNKRYSWWNLWLSRSSQCLPSFLGASPSLPIVMLMAFYSSRAW